MKNKNSSDKNILQDRIKKLIKTVSAGMYEREEIIVVSLLAALCGQNTFLFGPPGTAKSLISRRISCAFHRPTYFECLMNRFSTPEEVFGPVSIKALKEDRYTRKIDSYLPKADFAFLDEIWKSSPAVLNTLLTLINERIFKNGDDVEQVPLKALLAASNETPDINQGLEALYDRFIVRLMVQPITKLSHFEKLLNDRPSSSEADVPEELRVTPVHVIRSETLDERPSPFMVPCSMLNHVHDGLDGCLIEPFRSSAILLQKPLPPTRCATGVG